jgi:hypothetical protein
MHEMVGLQDACDRLDHADVQVIELNTIKEEKLKWLGLKFDALSKLLIIHTTSSAR